MLNNGSDASIAPGRCQARPCRHGQVLVIVHLLAALALWEYAEARAPARSSGTVRGTT